MSFSLRDLFSGGAADLVSEVGEAIDKNVTSDEERLEIERLIKSRLADIEEKVLEFHVQELDQVTKRHESDMKSDSWLSKNIRPLALVANTVFVMLFAMLTIAFSETETLPVIKVWIALFASLLTLQYGFYYGSRGIEKVAAIIGSNFSKKGTQ